MHQIQQPQQNPPLKPQYRTIKPQPSQLTQTLTRIMTHFKNSIHDGYFTQSMKRQGPGITFMDNDSIILGNYKNDNNIGLTLIFLSTDTYYIGQFNKGAIDGPFVIRTPNCTMYSTFVNNKIQGQFLMIDYQNWVANLWAIQNTGQGNITKQINLQQIMSSYLTYQQIKRKQSNSSSKLKLDKTKFIPYQQQIISHIAPYIQKLPNITQFLTNFKLTNNQYININGQQIFAYKFYQNNQIFYLNYNNSMNVNSNNNQFIGVCLNKKEEVIAYGQFKSVQFGKQQNSFKDKDRDIKKLSYQYGYHLNGLGVRIQHFLKKKQLKQTHIVCSGQFLNHKLHGQGCKYIEGQKTLYGKFIDDNIRNADIIKLMQQKTEQIKRLQLKYRKNKHIHSLKFYNNYTNQRPIYILNNLYQTMIVNNR